MLHIIGTEFGKHLPHVGFGVSGTKLFHRLEFGKVSLTTLLDVLALMTVPVNPFRVMLATVTQFPEPALTGADSDCLLLAGERWKESFVYMSLEKLWIDLVNSRNKYSAE
jgi:hypothetical protein